MVFLPVPASYFLFASKIFCPQLEHLKIPFSDRTLRCSLENRGSVNFSRDTENASGGRRRRQSALESSEKKWLHFNAFRLNKFIRAHLHIATKMPPSKLHRIFRDHARNFR